MFPLSPMLLRKSMTDHRNVPAKLFAHLKDPFGFAVPMAGMAGARKVKASTIKIKLEGGARTDPGALRSRTGTFPVAHGGAPHIDYLRSRPLCRKLGYPLLQKNHLSHSESEH